MNLPPIPIKILLGNDLKAWVDEWNPYAQQLPWRIETELQALLADLGISGCPVVEIQHSPEVTNLQVFGHGEVLPYPMSLVQRLSEYCANSRFDAPKLTPLWAAGLAEKLGEDVRTGFLSRLVLEIIKLHSHVLLGDEQVDTYLKRAAELGQGRNDKDVSRERVKKILNVLLGLKISIKQSEMILNSIIEASGRSDIEMIETLVTRLNPLRVEIAMSREYRKKLFNIELNEDEILSVYDKKNISEESLELFKMQADGLFYELGMRVPDIALTVVDIEECRFCFKLNDVWCAPQVGIAPEQLLVNDTKDRLKLLEINADMAINPANNNESSLIKVSDRPKAEEIGLTVWNPVGYLILALSGELRRNAGHLLHIEQVEYELAQLDQAFPELIHAVKEKVSTARLTRVLRALLDEEISIRDLRAILERVLACDYVIFDSSKHIVFDDRLVFHVAPAEGWQDDGHTIAQYVRMGLKRPISHKYTRGQSTLIVYLLDPEIEGLLLDHLAFENGDKEKATLSAEMTEKIRTAIREEIEYNLSPSAALPLILTISQIRYLVRCLIVSEFPELAVLAYEELSPDMNIQPIARISLPQEL